MTTHADLLTLLSLHQGQRNGISAAALAAQLDVPERLVRTWVSQLRAQGIAVVAHPTTGYYIAQTAQEIEACCAFLRSRAMHSLYLEARLRNIPLPDLLGQLRLRT